MENKKIQELVAKLQAENSEPLTENSAEQEDKNTIAEKVADVQDNRIGNIIGKMVGYPNDYFEIVEYNGQPFNGYRVGLEYNDWFKVKVNYDKIVSNFGKNCVIGFFSLTRTFQLPYSIYSAIDETFIERYDKIVLDLNYYGVELDKVYQKTGSADFIFRAEWEGGEALDLNSSIVGGVYLYVETKPKKMSYICGEIFDETGMVVKKIDDNGDDNGKEEVITDYTLSNTKINLSNKTVNINHKDLSTTLDVNIFSQSLIAMAEMQESTNGFDWQSVGYDRIYFDKADGKETRTVVKINTKDIDFCNLNSARLIMQLFTDKDTEAAADFYVNGKLCSKQKNSNTVFVDMGVVDASSDENIELIFTHCDKAYEFCATGELAPVIYVSRVVPVGTQKALKEFPLGDSARVYLDLNNRTSTAAFTSLSANDFAIPLNITHLYNNPHESSNYGKGWKLNLQKKLNISDDDDITNTKFVYTDEFGDSHEFEEKYYYVESGRKIFVRKDEIEIDLNGNLYYTDSKGTKFEVKKQQTCGNYTLIPEINDFKNSELIEQKISEQVELENFVNSYEPSLKNYVKVNSKNGEIVGGMGALTKGEYESLITGVDKTSENVIMSQSEALQLQSLYSSYNQLEYQHYMLLFQRDQTKVQKSQLGWQIMQAEQQLSDLSKHTFLDWIKYGDKLKGEYNDLDFMTQYRNNPMKSPEDDAYETAKLYVSYYSNEAMKDLLKRHGDEDDVYGIIPDMNDQLHYLERLVNEYDEQAGRSLMQMKLVQSQIDFLISQARENFEIIKDTFIKYFTKKAQLDLLVLQTPVNYLSDSNGTISGFNKDGDLVCLFDSFGNSVALEYDNEMRINSAYDSNGKVVKFEYNNNLLSSVTDSLGRTVKYEYDEEKLIKVVYPNGNAIDIGYSNDSLTSITYSNGIQYTISYAYGLLTNLLTERISPVSDIISEINLTYYSLRGTIITYDNGDKEEYEFNDYNELKSYSKHDGAGKGTQTTYEYTNDNKTVTATSCDNSDGRNIITTKNYDDWDMLLSEIADWQNISDAVRVKTETVYSYNSDNKPTQKTATKFIDNLGTITTKQSVTNYNYNAQGALVLVEQYVVGEEATSGKNFEKRIYGENGNLIKTVSWNSLDSSTKFYSENVTAENGQVTAEKDSTGEICAEYEYVDGTNVVNSVKYPNGSKLSYGRNPYDMTVTSVTQSTQDGIANQTDIAYEYGMPVKVKSGNTELNYTYDAKGRKAGVSINGELHSSYSYTDYRRISDKQVDFGEATQTLYDGTGPIQSEYTKNGVWDEEANAMVFEEQFTVGGDTLYSKHYLKDGKSDCLLYRDNGAFKAENYEYDSYNNLTKVSTLSDNIEVMSESYTYNGYGELTGVTLTGEANYAYSFNYEDTAERKLSSIEFGDYTVKPLSDIYGRSTGKEILNGPAKIAAEYVSYRKVGDHATNMPATVWFGRGANIKDSIKYKYDSCGNISEITENGALKARYAYDSLNRLTREDNKQFNKTYLYDYDNNGNILSKRVTMFTLSSSIEQKEFETHIYEYSGDRLMSFNGQVCEYNNLGNPTTYRGKAVEWQYGKLLTKLGDIKFSYDGLGRRVRKNDIRFVYDNEGKLVKQSNGLEFVYDIAGVVGVKFNGTQYFYRKDVQGNIIAILDDTGAVVVKYEYDAWGNNTVTAEAEYLPLANANPFRYRSYYYDVETGLYFLLTRYYDPELGRFISQDSIEYADPITANGLNLYAYCSDNPVMYIDSTGTSKLSEILDKIVQVIRGSVFAITGASIFISAFPFALFSPVDTVVSQVGLSLGFFGISSIIAVGDPTVHSDMELIHWNPLNSDADAVTKSEKISFYKGVPIIRFGSEDDTENNRSGTLGIMLLKRGADANLLKHEFGHIPQLMILGLGNFLLTVGLPSWEKWGYPDRWTDGHESPWEAMADMFGGASYSVVTDKEKRRAVKYLIASLFVGPFVHAFYYKL